MDGGEKGGCSSRATDSCVQQESAGLLLNNFYTLSPKCESTDKECNKELLCVSPHTLVKLFNWIITLK